MAPFDCHAILRLLLRGRLSHEGSGEAAGLPMAMQLIVLMSALP